MAQTLAQNKPGRRLTRHWMAAALVFVGMAVYFQAIKAPFLLDDNLQILQRTDYRQWDSLRENLLTDRRATTTLTLAINYALDGLNPRGYHLLNILIHLANSLLLMGLIRRTLSLITETPNPPPTQNASIRWLSFLGAGLWMVHPLATQAVVYVIQRAELLAVMAYLGALYALTRSIYSRHAKWWHIMVILCSVLGLYSKLIAVTIPLTVLLFDRTFLTGSFVKALKQRWMMYVGLIASWGVIYFNGATALFTSSDVTMGFSMKTVSPMQYLFAQSGVILHYLKLCVWPDTLVFDYGWPPPAHLSDYAISFAVMAALFCLTCYLVWRKPKVGFLPASVFLVLGPTSSVVPIADLAFEHRMYLPLASVVFMGVLFIQKLLKNKQSLAISTWGILLVALITRTLIRLHDYRDAISLWRTVVAVVPTHPRASIQLGNAFHHAGMEDEAARQYELTIQYHPDYSMAYNNLARYWYEKGYLDKAQAILQRGIELSSPPNQFIDLFNLANRYYKKGNLLQAGKLYQQALKINPKHLGSHINFAQLLARQGHLQQALQHLDQAQALAPAKMSIQINRASLLLQAHQPQQAIQLIQAVLPRLKNPAAALITLGSAHAMLNQWPQADQSFALLLQQQPNHRGALQRRAWLLATCPDPQIRNGPLAIQLATRLVTLTRQQDPRAWDTLAAAYAQNEQFEQANQAIQHAIALAQAMHDARGLARYTRRQQQYQHHHPFRLPSPPRK